MAGETHNLGIHDNEVLAEWFLYHLSLEQRHKLMAELPLIYSRLYPDVAAEVLGGYVIGQIQSERKA
jgi:hypothetical protein